MTVFVRSPPESFPVCSLSWELGFDTGRANTVGELRPRVSSNISLQLLPVSLVVADLLAPRTDWKQTLEFPHLSKRVVERRIQLPFPVKIGTDA